MSKALEAGLKAVEVQPRNTAALNNLAVTYARLDRIEDAAELWRRSLAIDPNQERIRAYLESAAAD